MRWIIDVIFLLFLVVCSLEVIRTRDLIKAVILFSAYSLIMSVMWSNLSAPDLAITEAAVGAGVSTLLFIAAISRTKRWARE